MDAIVLGRLVLAATGCSKRTTAPHVSSSYGWILFVSDRDGDPCGWSCRTHEIYIMNADGSGLTRLTNYPGNDSSPAWSPDGSKLAFASERDGNLEVYVMNADGSIPTRLTNNPGFDGEPDWGRRR